MSDSPPSPLISMFTDMSKVRAIGGQGGFETWIPHLSCEFETGPPNSKLGLSTRSFVWNSKLGLQTWSSTLNPTLQQRVRIRFVMFRTYSASFELGVQFSNSPCPHYQSIRVLMSSSEIFPIRDLPSPFPPPFGSSARARAAARAQQRPVLPISTPESSDLFGFGDSTSQENPTSD